MVTPVRRCRLLAIGKWEKRKGYDVLLPAFVREFGSDDAVELLIVSSSFHDERDWKVRVAAALGPHAGTAARVRIVENVSTVVLSKIYRSATAFGASTRAAFVCASQMFVSRSSTLAWRGMGQALRGSHGDAVARYRCASSAV